MTASPNPPAGTRRLRTWLRHLVSLPSTTARWIGRAENRAASALQYPAVSSPCQRAERLLAVRAAQQESVARIGMRAVSDSTLDALFGEVVEVVRATLVADYCTILELHTGAVALRVRAGAGWRANSGRGRMGLGRESPGGYALLVRQPVIVEDAQRETRFRLPLLLLEHEVSSGATVIIYDQEVPFGVLEVYSRARGVFTSDDVHFLEVIANLIATALRRQRAEAERDALLARAQAGQEESERASQTKSEFLAMLSHELRTPLSTLSGYLDLMELGLHGPLTAAQRRDLARIRRCQQYLLSLINNVLVHMKLGSGRIAYEITSVPLDDCLAAVEELIRPQMDTKELHYERRGAGNGLRVRADREKLEQIVLNLLSNAAKYTNEGGSVTVEGVVAGDTVSVRVEDTGCGIPEDWLQAVFEPYVQVRQADGRAGEGTGLGLAISRELARGMGGDILAESWIDRGSVFTVLLPLDGDPAAVDAATVQVSQSG